MRWRSRVEDVVKCERDLVLLWENAGKVLLPDPADSA